MSKCRLQNLTIALCLSAVLAVSASAAEVSWKGATSGKWSDTTQWDGGAIPTDKDDVAIKVDGTYTVTIDADAEAAKVTLGGGTGTQTLQISDKTLDVKGDINVGSSGVLGMTNGKISGTGKLINKGTLTLKNSEIDMTVENSGSITLDDSSKVKMTTSESSMEDPGYSTKYFFVHAGVVTLNPYKIVQNSNSSTGYSLEAGGETDTNSFLEAVLKHRSAWLREAPKKPFDFELRMGIYGNSNGDSSGSVVAGSSDASAEVSLGWHLLHFGKSYPGTFFQNYAVEDEKPFYTLNLEGMYGAVTDKGSQEIHSYSNVGIVSVWGIPWKNGEKHRNLEALFGVYLGWVDTPDLNGDTTEVNTRNGFPAFKTTRVTTLRGDFHIPMGENGFLTIAGRFHNPPFGNDGRRSDKMQPWSLSAGVTVPIEKVVDKFVEGAKTVFEQ